MTDHTAKNIVGRDLINLRECLARIRPFLAKVEVDEPSAATSELLGRVDMLIYRHADPELDIAKMWAAGDWRNYPTCCDGNDPACPTHGVRASNARQNEYLKNYDSRKK